MSCPFLADRVVVRVARAQHDPEDEPAVSSLDPEYFEFDCASPLFYSFFSRPTRAALRPTDQELNKEELKKLLYDEVMSFQSLL